MPLLQRRAGLHRAGFQLPEPMPGRASFQAGQGHQRDTVAPVRSSLAARRVLGAERQARGTDGALDTMAYSADRASGASEPEAHEQIGE